MSKRVFSRDAGQDISEWPYLVSVSPRSPNDTAFLAFQGVKSTIWTPKWLKLSFTSNINHTMNEKKWKKKNSREAKWVAGEEKITVARLYMYV